MKYIKTYESTDIIFNRPWSRIKLQRINKLKDDLQDEENKLIPLLNKYCLLNKDLTKVYGGYDFMKVVSYRYRNNFMRVDFYDEQYNMYSFKLTDEKLNDLFNFLKDPDKYENVKKYNL